MITLILLLVQFFHLKKMNQSCSYTQRYINTDIGYITYICGVVGAGKTTLGCGITNDLNLTLIKKAEDTIKSFTTIYYDFDFNEAKRIISVLTEQNKNSDEIVKAILSLEYYSILGKMFFDNFLSDSINAVKMIKNFVEAYQALIRNNYVFYYNRGFYSHITETYAHNFTPDMMNIKDRYINKDYSIPCYSIIFEDEKQISGKISTNFQAVAKEDGGSDLFLRLIRQLGKGTIYYITTSQEFGRAVKVERMLATSILYIIKRRTINPYYFSTILCSICKMVLDWLFSIRSLIVGKVSPDSYLDNSIIKKWIFKLDQIRRKNFSRSYVEYKCIKYNNAEDVGKRKEITAYGAEDVTLTFPLTYCFGSIDTHAFSVVQDFLVKNSDRKVVEANDKSDNSTFVREILKKNQDSKGNK